ncbi:class I SAM-dependent methyltransferase [Candidatus Woesearchaeota archaeon]|nr:class I SAM-dependent methyltransferase [Candidatus Woesearchaeota archaeon]
MKTNSKSEVTEFVNCNLCNSSSTRKLMAIGGFNIVKCKNCGLAYVNPRLKERKLHEIYDKKYFSNKAFNGAKTSFYGYGKYLEEEDCIKDTFRRRLKIINKLSGKGRLLDIGCAFGFFLELARDDGWDVQGLEISEYAYSYAKNVLKLPVMNKTLEKAKLKSDSFDVVTIFDVIEHLPDPKATLKEIRRVLKPNGFVVITTPNIGSMTAKILWKNWEEVRRVREHIYFFSKSTLKKILESLGFEVLRTESAGRYFSVKMAVERGKLYNKAIFILVGKISDSLGLSDKRIYVDPRYKMTMYARKIK